MMGLTVFAVANAVRNREVSAADVAEGALQRAAHDQCNAFAYLTPELAERDAERVDRTIAQGDDPGPLAGVPFAVKDVHDVAGFVTGHGSLAFRQAPPAPSDSAIVRRLRRAGAIVIGKTTTSELEFSPASENPVTGLTEHPTHSGHTAGGSSGGSAVAVATGIVPLATGTDGGGSLRIPAAACGLSTVKATAGVVVDRDGWGQSPAWPALTALGVLASDLESTIRVLDLLSARPFSPPLKDIADRASDGHAPSLAWVPEFGWAETAPAVVRNCAAAVDALAAAGARVCEGRPIGARDPAPLWTALAAIGTHRWLDSHPTCPEIERVSKKLRHLIVNWTGRAESPPFAAFGQELNTGLVNALGDADVLVCPTCVDLPPTHLDAASGHWVKNTYVFNIAGWAAATIPVRPGPDGRPVGLQIAAPPGRDADLVGATAWIEVILRTHGGASS